MADDQIEVLVTADISGLEDGLNRASAAASDSFDDLNKAASDAGAGVASLGTNATANLGKARSATAAWSQSFAPVLRAFDTSVSGMILGTTTWQKAVSRLAQSVLAEEINYAVKRLAAWTASELGMTTATTAGAAERGTVEATASTTSLLGMAANALKAIAIDAAQTFGGVFAFLSTSMGPAAAAPAVAAQGAVMEAGSMIVAAGGAWNVPSDMLAMVHQQELILPANIAAPMRNFFSSGGAGGGGDSYAITIQAIDTQSGAQFLMNNSGAIAKGLARERRNANPNLRVR